jgi:hypothetical protein
VLTCKSLFGLGYRGERLIEPSALVVDRAGGITNVPALVLFFLQKQGDTVKLPGNPAASFSFSQKKRRPWASGTAGSTRREARQAPRRKPRVW